MCYSYVMKNHEIIDNRWVLHNLIHRGGYWMARVRDIKTKKTRYYATRKSNRREALAAARGWIKLLAAEEGAPESVLFKAAYAEFLSVKTDIRAVSLKDYTTKAEGLFLPTFGSMVVSSIRFADVEDWNKKMAGRLSPRTRATHVHRLSSFFCWAVRRGYTKENPVEGVRLTRAEASRPTVLTTEQARALLATPMADRLRLAILLALHTGLRRKNVAELRWGDVNLVERKIALPAARMKGGAAIELPIHPELYEELKVLPFLDPAAFVLGAVVGRPDWGFHRALTAAGLPLMRWHDLRHTFAAWVGARCTHDMKKALLGHAAKDMTDHYGGVSLVEKQAAVDLLPRLLGGPERDILPQEATP